MHSHISAAGNIDMKPEDAFAMDPEPRPNVNLGQVDPEMMSFDAKRRLLIVSGAVTVGEFDFVHGEYVCLWAQCGSRPTK